MIGILCSDGKEKEYAETFHSLQEKTERKKGDDIIVFTTSNIDLIQMKVKGSLVTAKGIDMVEISLPTIIFNFSLQRDMKGVKVRKELEKMSTVKFINDTNKYNQSMIMDIISSSKETQRYLLPYHIYNKAIRNFKTNDEQIYIAMPSRGASISRVIYAEPIENSNMIGGTQYFKKGQICDYIDASLCQSQWVFIDVPKLMTDNNHPIIVRSYLQKVLDKSWSVLDRTVYPESNVQRTEIMNKTDKSALILIKYISSFLPSLGVAFIDFIFSSDGKPYFLHLGGFDQNFFEQKRNEEVYKRFYKNLFSLTSDYKAMEKEDK